MSEPYLINIIGSLKNIENTVNRLLFYKNSSLVPVQIPPNTWSGYILNNNDLLVYTISVNTLNDLFFDFSGTYTTDAESVTIFLNQQA